MDKCSSALMTLRIIEILKEHDKNNPITQIKLAERLGVDRKTVWRAFINMEREMNFVPGQIKGKGYYYIKQSNDFEAYEVRIIMDGIASSVAISKKETQQIIEKLAKLLNTRERKMLLKSYSFDRSAKAQHENTLLNVDMLTEATVKKRKIVFDYTIPDTKQVVKYIASPGKTVFEGGLYMFVAKDVADDIVKTFRIDYMSNIGIIENAVSEVNENEI